VQSADERDGQGAQIVVQQREQAETGEHDDNALGRFEERHGLNDPTRGI